MIIIQGLLESARLSISATQDNQTDNSVVQGLSLFMTLMSESADPPNLDPGLSPPPVSGFSSPSGFPWPSDSLSSPASSSTSIPHHSALVDAACPEEPTPPLSRPSEYLRQQCPLCFGGKQTHDPNMK